MNEMTKTGAFAGAAALVVLLGVVTFPYAPRETADALDDSGAFFPDLKPEEAASIEITTFDEKQGQLRVPFKVAKINGLWSLPSHENYPADAADQLGQAAAELAGLRRGPPVTDKPAEHAEFGVVSPDPKSLEKSSTGVGRTVTLADSDGNTMASIVIGRAHEDPQDQLYYVRVLDETPDVVYRVKLDKSKFTMKFSAWIEKDLLKLDSTKIMEIVLSETRIEEVERPDGRLGLRKTPGEITALVYDDKASPPAWKTDGLGPDEQLDASKISTLKFALDDLKIVNVSRKPDGLQGEFAVDESLAQDPQRFQSLIQMGFYPVGEQNPDGSVRFSLYTNDGEVLCRMKDGVEYVLRFGRSIPAEAASEDDLEQEESDDSSLTPPLQENRIVMISARFNKDLIPLPELLPVPAGPDPPPPAAAPPPADSQPPPPSAEGAASDDPAAPGEPTKPKTPEEIERERIVSENQKKTDAYNDSVKQGEERVKELNDRFSGWYYVVSDDEYKKIHITRKDVVTTKTPSTTATPPPPGNTFDDFDALIREGIDKSGARSAP
jgi:hypothetical protein